MQNDFPSEKHEDQNAGKGVEEGEHGGVKIGRRCKIKDTRHMNQEKMTEGMNDWMTECGAKRNYYLKNSCIHRH